MDILDTINPSSNGAGEEPCDCVIMAGGFGTRLRPITASLPKPMVPLANRPILEHVIELLKQHGFRRVMMLVFYQPEIITSHFGDGSDFGITIRYLKPNGDYGTAGAVMKALPRLAERFLVISGDVLTDIDLRAAVEFHDTNTADATLVLTRRENPLAYGVVITDDSGRITRFLEKPAWSEVISDAVNTGIYVLDQSIFTGWPTDTSVDFGHDVFPGSLRDRKRLYGYIGEGYWRDIGNLEEYAEAHYDILAGTASVSLIGSQGEGGGSRLTTGEGVEIGTGVECSGTVILGDRVVVGDGARLTDVVIGDNTRIGPGTNAVRSVIWNDVDVGAHSHLSETIVQNNTRLGDSVTLMDRAIVSEQCTLGDGVTVRSNCKIWPGKEIEAGATVSVSVVWGDQFNRELFSDAKVSGLTNREITPEFVGRLGAAFAGTFPTGSTIVVGRDSSPEARMTGEALKAGLLSSGVSVRDLQTTVIPLMRYELQSGHAAHGGGVYLRRNPLDPQKLDAIFFDPSGKDLSTTKCKSVERAYYLEDFRRISVDAMGSVVYPRHLAERYREDFLRRLDVEALARRRFQIVIDYDYGPFGEILPPLLHQLGIGTVTVHPSQILGAAVPADEETAHPVAPTLAQIVSALHYDLGIVVDARGEKMRVIDGQGRILSNQHQLLAMLDLFWRLNPGAKVAAPVLASDHVDRLARKHGGSVVRVKNDHLAMMAAGELPDVSFVVGTRGGCIFPDFQQGADAAYATVKLLESLALANVPLAEIVDAVEPGVMIEDRLDCPWSKKGQVMRALMRHTEGDGQMTIDGIRVTRDDGWVWAAPERREAGFAIVAESDDEETARRYVAEMKELLVTFRDGVAIPV